MSSPTFGHVDERPDFPALEEAILTRWKETDAFQKSLKQSEGRPRYNFYDGPPFATGLPHYGHLLTGTIKDVVTRYAHQTGHWVPRRFGWDCHGLPVEYEIDKELGVTNRNDIVDNIGIDRYNEKCRSIVMKYCKQWQKTVERAGRWIDFDNDYKTLQPDYMESIWWVFSELYKKGLVYRDFKVMPYSTACSTPLSNFEAGQNYKDVHDPSIVVAFPVLPTGSNPLACSLATEKAALLAWTTTPWTLPSNLGLCVNADFEYLKFKVIETGHIYIVALCRFANILKEMKLGVKHLEKVLEGEDISKVEILKKGILGSELVGLEYEPLFDFFSRNLYWKERAWRVMADNYVTSDSGTGIVHQAPAFGEDDWRVCSAHGLLEKGGEVPCPVDESGCLTKPIDHPDLIGLHVKEADKPIKHLLKEMGRLVVNDTAVHPYPHCWRSDTPLIYKAVPSWFVKVEQIKDQMVAANAATRWVPSAVGEKRFHNWLSDARDWCISRNRFWGTPLPLWVSKDFTQIRCIGSISELQQYTEKPLTDIHRHFIDDISIPDPRGSDFPPLRRVEEVFDCWFESGSMPYAQVHYPFESKESFEKSFPADFVGEGLDQTRGWFYTLTILGTALFGKAPWKNLIVNGLVLAEDGKKMSKRLKNYPDPEKIFNEVGADALRLYLVSSPVVRAETLKFSEKGLKEVIKNVLLPWYHSVRFLTQEVQRYEAGGKHKWKPLEIDNQTAGCNYMDKWILSLTQSLIKFFHEEMQNYRLYTSLPRLLTYLDQLTNWYVRLNRERMRGNASSEESLVSLSVLYTVLLDFTCLMAPFTPFLSESLYQILRKALPDGHSLLDESVHYVMLPQPKGEMISIEMETAVGTLQSLVQLGRALRNRFKATIKTPLKELSVISGDEETLISIQPLQDYIRDELNAFEINFKAEKDRIQFSALPNLKLLGAKYGKDLKALIPAIKGLGDAELRKLDGGGSVTVLGKDLTAEDILLQRSPQGFNETETLGVECDSVFVIVADFAVTEEMRRQHLGREISTRVQKLRKASGLRLDDEVITVLTSGEGDIVLEQFLRDNIDIVAQMLRRPMQTVVPEGREPSVSSETKLMDDETLLIRFYSVE